MASPQKAIFTSMGQHQWYLHLSREEGADLGAIRGAIKNLITTCETKKINLVIGFGPSLLADLGADMPNDFQPFETIKSIDGSDKEAIGTQEELLFWLNSPAKDEIWLALYEARTALKPHMSVARETPTFIYGNSQDMTGFIDGTGNPPDEEQPKVALIPDGESGSGGSFILAQRWIHDLEGWNEMSIPDQEKAFGRTKDDSTLLEEQEDYSHFSHIDQSMGNQIARRSTPYALHDGIVGLYFMAFCKEQETFRKMLNAMYGMNGEPRDRITDYSDPASGAFYFAPSQEELDKIVN